MRTRTSFHFGALLLKSTFSSLVLLALATAITGCSKRFHDLPAFSALPLGDPVNHSVGRFKTSYLADQIHAYFRGSINGPIAVTTFVDIDNLYQSSTFGRVLGEQLMSELAMRGYNVVEMRASDAMQVQFNKGEFGLSRDVSALRGAQDISAIVVGTYTVSPLRVYVNTRVIDPRSSLVVSAGTVEMAKTREITRLVRAGSFPGSLERIPVRHLGYGMYPAPFYYPQMAYPWPYAPQPNVESDSWQDDQKAKPAPKLPEEHSKILSDAEQGS